MRICVELCVNTTNTHPDRGSHSTERRGKTNCVYTTYINVWAYFRGRKRIIMSILNQAAVEALCSATYLENYLETMDNLPDDLQRIVTQLRELDIQCRGKHFFPLKLSILLMKVICSNKCTFKMD